MDEEASLGGAGGGGDVPPHAFAGAPEGPTAYCWACAVLIAVPLVQGRPAQAFKCGHCAAINTLDPPEQRRRRWGAASCAGRAARAALAAGRWAVVAVVVALVASVAVTGVVVLLPRLCTTWATYGPNLLLSAAIAVNVTANLAACVAQPAGAPRDWAPPPPRGPHGEVRAGSYDGWAWCARCAAAKPPAAHHCRSCGCVVDMDHHCPFINNCVGAGNLRPFMLLLLWTLLAAAYVLAMCGLLVSQQWHVVRASVAARGGAPPPGAAGAAAAGAAGAAGAGARRPPSAWLIASTGVFFVFMQLAPGWLLAAYYMVAVCTALLLGVGVLLGSQLAYLARGETYVESLKAGRAGGAGACAGERRGWQVAAARLAELLDDGGGGLARALLVPRWRPRSAGPAAAAPAAARGAAAAARPSAAPPARAPLRLPGLLAGASAMGQRASKRSSAPAGPVQELPVELLTVVLRRLSVRDRLGAAARVSRVWRAAAVLATSAVQFNTSEPGVPNSVELKLFSKHDMQKGEKFFDWLLGRHGRHVESVEVTWPGLMVQLSLLLPQLPALRHLRLECAELQPPDAPAADGEAAAAGGAAAAPAAAAGGAQLTSLWLHGCCGSLARELSSLTALRDLELSELIIASNLAALSELRVLAVDFECDAELDLRFLTGVRALTSLSLGAGWLSGSVRLSVSGAAGGLALIGQLQELRELRLSKVAAAQLPPLPASLTLLRLRQCSQLELAADCSLRELPRLESLALIDVAVFDPALLQHHASALTSLSLGGWRVACLPNGDTRTLLRVLPLLRELRHLRLGRAMLAPLDADDLAALDGVGDGDGEQLHVEFVGLYAGLTASPHLTELDLRGCDLPAGALLAAFPAAAGAPACAALRALRLGVDEEAFCGFAEVTDLSARQCDPNGPVLGAAELARIAGCCPGLQELSLLGALEPKQQWGLRALLQLSALTLLVLGGESVDDGLAGGVLARLTGLRDLSVLASQQLSPRGIVRLTALTALTRLHVESESLARDLGPSSDPDDEYCNAFKIFLRSEASPPDLWAQFDDKVAPSHPVFWQDALRRRPLAGASAMGQRASKRSSDPAGPGEELPMGPNHASKRSSGQELPVEVLALVLRRLSVRDRLGAAARVARAWRAAAVLATSEVQFNKATGDDDRQVQKGKVLLAWLGRHGRHVERVDIHSWWSLEVQLPLLLPLPALRHLSLEDVTLLPPDAPVAGGEAAGAAAAPAAAAAGDQLTSLRLLGCCGSLACELSTLTALRDLELEERSYYDKTEQPLLTGAHELPSALTRLSVSSLRGWSASTIPNLAALSELRALSVHLMRDAELDLRVFARLHALTSLSLGASCYWTGNPRLSFSGAASGLAPISQLQELRELRLSKWAAAQLPPLPASLTLLELRGCGRLQLTADCSLRELPCLQSLALIGAVAFDPALLHHHASVLTSLWVGDWGGSWLSVHVLPNGDTRTLLRVLPLLRELRHLRLGRAVLAALWADDQAELDGVDDDDGERLHAEFVGLCSGLTASPHLTELDLRGCDLPNGALLTAFPAAAGAPACAALRVLRLGVDEQAFDGFIPYTYLYSDDCGPFGPVLGAAELARIAGCCPGLQELSLLGAPKPEERQGLRALLQLSALTLLVLGGESVDDGVARSVLARLTGLRELSVLASEQLSPRGIVRLTALTALTRLHVESESLARDLGPSSDPDDEYCNAFKIFLRSEASPPDLWAQFDDKVAPSHPVFWQDALRRRGAHAQGLLQQLAVRAREWV
ncbi:PAT11 [Scenedesmus sp. PABB004]|nr:PAT11 [Scenedesmus sp. PABB004]